MGACGGSSGRGVAAGALVSCFRGRLAAQSGPQPADDLEPVRAGIRQEIAADSRCMANGIQMSVGAATSMPVKPRAATPTMVNVCALSSHLAADDRRHRTQTSGARSVR